MTIVNVGVSHRIAPVEVLEKLAVPADQIGDLLARLHAEPSIDEVTVLSTCNRLEVYVAAPGPVEPVVRAVASRVAGGGPIPASEVLRLARVRVGSAAAEHLFSVACGLDSMAVGEDQIVAQIKAAARSAAAAGTTGQEVTGLIDAALRVSKRARTQTTISTAGISLARAGLEVANAHLGGLAGRGAVVLGSGSVGRLAARLLREAGVGQLFVASRREAGARKVADAVQGTPLAAGDLLATVGRSDILVTATGAARPVLLAEQVRAARARSGGRPLCIVDLGMPPDVEPAVGELAGVTLLDLSALGRHLADRAVPDQIPEVRALVAAETAEYSRRQQETAAAPVIAALHAHIRQLADGELARLHDRLPDLSEAHHAETAATVHRILRKILHQPTVRAKALSGGTHGPDYLEALRQLFGLDAGDATI
ncbi:MAG: hemA [Actinomycetia bacterium]|nr:hemA [Actinomycetes bacterium]